MFELGIDGIGSNISSTLPVSTVADLKGADNVEDGISTAGRLNSSCQIELITAKPFSLSSTILIDDKLPVCVVGTINWANESRMGGGLCELTLEVVSGVLGGRDLGVQLVITSLLSHI